MIYMLFTGLLLQGVAAYMHLVMTCVWRVTHLMCLVLCTRGVSFSAGYLEAADVCVCVCVCVCGCVCVHRVESDA